VIVNRVRLDCFFIAQLRPRHLQRGHHLPHVGDRRLFEGHAVAVGVLVVYATARSLFAARKFPQSLTYTLWLNWVPLLFIGVTPNHLTASHIPREIRDRKHPNALC